MQHDFANDGLSYSLPEIATKSPLYWLPPVFEEWLPGLEAAQRLGVTHRTVKRRGESGKLRMTTDLKRGSKDLRLHRETLYEVSVTEERRNEIQEKSDHALAKVTEDFQSYFAEIQRIARLENWVFGFEFVEDADYVISSHVVKGMPCARICLSPSFFQLSAEKQRSVIAGCLAYCCFSGLSESIRDLEVPGVELVLEITSEQEKFFAKSIEQSSPLPTDFILGKQEYRVDKEMGFKYRAKHSYPDFHSFCPDHWIDIDEAVRDPAQRALLHRLGETAEEAIQIKLDVEHWNRIRPYMQPLKISIDFEQSARQRMEEKREKFKADG